jgi:hypothetical protein
MQFIIHKSSKEKGIQKDLLSFSPSLSLSISTLRCLSVSHLDIYIYICSVRGKVLCVWWLVMLYLIFKKIISINKMKSVALYNICLVKLTKHQNIY